MAGKNIGDLLNASHISWGWFEGGFNLGAIPNANGTYGCNRSTPGTQGNTSTDPDYIQHHQPFQYYATTANLHHLRPSSVSAIGNTYENDAETIDPANHQYDTSDFFAALQIQNIPAVSFLKAPGFEDGHPGYSDPLDEQRFIVQVLNALQASPLWSSTAVIITYDDSDGWYDHQMPPIVNPSSSALVDALSGAGSCTGVTAAASQQGIVTPATPLLGNDGNPAQGRCGYGTRWHEPVTERPELDSVEIWSFANTTRDIHPIHLHLVRFQVLDRRSFDADEYLLSGKLNYLGPAAIPPPGDGGWKDTVQTYPETVTRIIVRFEGYTGRYVWHCHLLEHAANEMMRPFEVVAKGMG